jgi:hypothetical protein
MTASKPPNHWFTGASRSGKTQKLVELATQFLPALPKNQHLLLLAANDESKQEINDRVAIASGGYYPIRAQTPLGFLQSQVHLFYPLIVSSLQLPAINPIRLRPETEQALATELWQPELQTQPWKKFNTTEYRLIRRLLDLIQLAANSQVEISAIPDRLSQGYGEHELFPQLGAMMERWQSYCLERGLLTYGLASDLFWRCLWVYPSYQSYFQQRYGALIADDADDYPAIAYPLLESFIGFKPTAIAYNPHGQIRLGLSSDPQHILKLSLAPEELPDNRSPLEQDNTVNLIDGVIRTVNDPSNWLELPNSIREISRHTRGEMLRTVVETIAEAIQTKQIQPQEIAIIVPGLDNIARYTLTEAFAQQRISITALNNQQPLYAAPSVRAILTLVALTWPGLGKLLDRDQVAEMLVELSRYRNPENEIALGIDPVRAGLIADHCYSPNPDRPQLQPITDFLRWDRLGARAAASYQKLRSWIEQLELKDPVRLMDSIVAEFFDRGSLLTADLLAAQRALMETAQHFWQVADRVNSQEDERTRTARFILLLRQGTVGANPYPSAQLSNLSRGVTLANIFQYRSSKKCHRWHFWLDVGSDLWAKGGTASLYGSRCFLQDWERQLLSPEEEELLDRQRLERILRDLLQRSNERLYLCNSELSVSGQEQLGPLLTLQSRVLPDVALAR